jgi:hypothetical protein
LAKGGHRLMTDQKDSHMKSHSRIRNAAVIILIALVALSCGRSRRQRLAIAYVIDMTASVDNEAIMQAFAAIQPLLNSKTLKRGDSIAIIPITGDTLTESQGKIIRIHLPENREVYDSDLAKLAREVEEKLRHMQEEATASPYQHSDILGAADLAAEELSNESGSVRKVIVILSDFIQDDSRFNFNVSPDLANTHAAEALARKLSLDRKGEFAATLLYLGILRSKDLKKMPNARREAVQTFWREYFKNDGASSVSWAIDGPGKIQTSVTAAE